MADALTGGRGDTVMVGGQPKHVIGYMRDFLFAPEQARTPLGVLSGGERGRLMLARALAKPSNVLVLDEPTNDLDLETLDVLEEMLGDYAGTVLLISHDRDFLDRVVNAVIAPEGGGRLRGICRRLQRHAGSARRGSRARAGEAGGAERIERAESRRRASSKPAKRRLSFHEKHALETLPKTIAALQAKVRALARPAGRSRPLCPRPQGLRRDLGGARGGAGGIGGGRGAMAGARDVAGRACGRITVGSRALQVLFTLFPEGEAPARRNCYDRRRGVIELAA